MQKWPGESALGVALFVRSSDSFVVGEATHTYEDVHPNGPNLQSQIKSLKPLKRGGHAEFDGKTVEFHCSNMSRFWMMMPVRRLNEAVPATMYFFFREPNFKIVQTPHTISAAFSTYSPSATLIAGT